MKVAVLVPCFNVENYIDETLESLKNQTLKDLVVYTLDDCSTDNTYDKLVDFQYKKVANAIKYFYTFRSPLNCGWCGSYNKLAELAIQQGCEYLMILGSDDNLEPTCLEKMLRLIEETNSDFCIVTGKMFGDGESIMYSKENATVEDFRNSNAIANFALIKASMWNELGGYDTSFRYADWEFWIRAIKSGKKYCIVSEPLYNYRLHATNDHKKANHQIELDKIQRKHFIF